MSDIVRDLYGEQAHYETEPEYERLCQVLGDGAKEIKRLRAALREIADMDWKQADTLELAIEIAKEALGDE